MADAVTKSSTDPRGWLSECPELERFSTDPGVAAAIAKGDGLELVTALRKRRAAGRGPGEERAIDAILAKRRLFVMPVGGAPRLFTFNGIGSSMVGRSDKAPDGSYVGTLFFVVFFLPVWPIAQYLVASQGSSYLFFGKVPLSGTMRVWRLAVAGLVVAGAVALGGMTWRGGQSARVHLVNGLDVPVVIEVAGGRHTVPGRGDEVEVELPTGRQHVRAVTKEGKVLEELDVEVPARTRLVAYSVLGAAPLVVETVTYGNATGPLQPEVFAGRSFVTRGSVDLVFEPAPQQIQTKGEGGTRTRAWIPAGGWRTAVNLLVEVERAADAEKLANAVLQALPRTEDALAVASGLAFGRAGNEAALAVAEAVVKADPTFTDAHRVRQGYLDALGRVDEARRIYRELEAAQPDSALAAYLRARVEQLNEAERLFTAGLARFPDDPYFLRAVGWSHYLAGRHAEALRAWERLAKLDPAAAKVVYEEQAFALVAAGRSPEAVALVARHVDAKPDLPGALLYARVTKVAPAVPRRRYLEDILSRATPGESAYLRTVSASVLGDPPPPPKELAAIEQPDARAAAVFLAQALSDPTGATRGLAKAEQGVLMRLDPTWRLLLAGEVARSEPALALPLAAELDAVPGLGGHVARFVRGEEPPALAELPPEHRTALLLGRARALEASAKDARAVYAEVRRREAVPGPVSVALARWPRPAREPRR